MKVQSNFRLDKETIEMMDEACRRINEQAGSEIFDRTKLVTALVKYYSRSFSSRFRFPDFSNEVLR